MPSKDAMYDAKVAAAKKAAAKANTIKQVGPSGGLRAGVIAGVNPPPVAETVIEPVIEPENPQWVKVSTIQTASGPVDVDANGLAADGSKPVAISAVNPITFTATDGTIFNDEATYKKYQELLGDKKSISDTRRREGESAYNILYKKFSEFGLGSLVESLQSYIQDGLSEDELTLRLRETPAYQKRFSANKQRIAKGLSALSEASYIKMEDQYQEVMRQYGLPETYWSKDSMGTQKGFEDLLANDVSNTELEDRLLVAQDRVLKSNPEVLKALKDFYPDIKNGDILAYTLDPKNAIKDIQRKVTAAEIGGAALQQEGLTTNLARAEELQRYGVDKRAATEGYSTIGAGLQRGSELAAIYGESPYTQATAESEEFKLTGAQEARKQRQKITGLEKATFGGQTGLTSGALARDRAGGY
jgi:hypothetical protein